MCVTVDGHGLVNGFIDHLYIPLGTTSNHNAIADFHTFQITTRLQPAVSSLVVAW
jgi:hypothetical protein